MSTGVEREPYRLIDVAGHVVDPVSVFLRELQAMGGPLPRCARMGWICCGGGGSSTR